MQPQVAEDPQAILPQEEGLGEEGQEEESQPSCSACSYWQQVSEGSGECGYVDPENEQALAAINGEGVLVTLGDFYCAGFQPKEEGVEVGGQPGEDQISALLAQLMGKGQGVKPS
jgi:hypothetical protein